MDTIYYTTHRIPWVELLIASRRRGLLAVSFMAKGGKEAELKRLRHRHPDATFVESTEENEWAIEELKAYAGGELQKFTLPLDLCGSPFQVSVWKTLLKIPYGETRSYAEIARACGHAKAYRAVGLANRANPICIVVPCHRVIASNGDLCGFAGGLDLKRALLEHERKFADAHGCQPTRAAETAALPGGMSSR